MTVIDAANSGTAEVVRPFRKPRLWTLFAVLVAAIVLVLVSQALVVVPLVVWMTTHGTTPARLESELTTRLTNPWMFIVLGLASQGAMLAVTLIAARLSPEPTASRIGLRPSGLPPAGFVAAAFGSWLPLAVGLMLASSLPEGLWRDESIRELYAQMTWSVSIPFLLFISLAPGFVEEVLFRGYVQQRLLSRWSAWVAIIASSVVFALFHVTPHAFVLTFPLGVWFGWLAWQTRSVWPGIVCHAFVNGSWNVGQLGMKLAGLPEEPPLVVLVLLGLIATSAFAAAVWLVRKHAAKPRVDAPD